MAKDAGKKSFLDFFKVKNIDDDEDEFDDDLFDDDDYDDDDDDDYEDVKPRASKSKPSSASQLHVPLPNTKQLHSRHRLHIGVLQAVHPVANWLISRTPRSLTAEAQISATVVKYL